MCRDEFTINEIAEIDFQLVKTGLSFLSSQFIPRFSIKTEIRTVTCSPIHAFLALIPLYKHVNPINSGELSLL